MTCACIQSKQQSHRNPSGMEISHSHLQALSVALKTFVKPVRDALAALPGEPVDVLRTLTSLLDATTSCCSRLVALFPDVEPRVLASLTHPLFQPYESFIGDYARLEAVVLTQEVCNLKAHAGWSSSMPARVPMCAVVCTPETMQL